MKQSDQKMKALLVQEITDSNMKFKRKMKVLKLLDQAFREYLGVIYLSDQEIEERDILNRSM